MDGWKDGSMDGGWIVRHTMVFCQSRVQLRWCGDESLVTPLNTIILTS